MLCRECRRQVVRGAAFCGSCGAPLGDAGAPLELVLAGGARVPLVEEVTIDMSRPKGLLDLGEREPEDVIRGRKDPGVGEFLSFPQNAALRKVEELDDVLLGVLAQADPGAVHGDEPSHYSPLEPRIGSFLQPLEEPGRGPLGPLPPTSGTESAPTSESVRT